MAKKIVNVLSNIFSIVHEKYDRDKLLYDINFLTIDKENKIETSLIPSIPSLNVLTTYSIGFAIEIDLQKSGSMFIE